MNEAETRAEHIDPALKVAGWGVVEGSKILREHRITAGRIEGYGRRGQADIAKIEITTHFNTRQRVFLAFVLSHYVTVGVDELASEKLTPLLRLRYHDSLNDAVADLGQPDDIQRAFAGFQKYLYQSTGS